MQANLNSSAFKTPSSQGTLHATRSATLIDVERKRKTALHDVLLPKSLLGISCKFQRPGPSACPEISQARSNQRVQPLPNLVTPLVIQPSSNIQLQPFLSILHPTIAYCTTNCSISTSNTPNSSKSHQADASAPPPTPIGCCYSFLALTRSHLLRCLFFLSWSVLLLNCLHFHQPTNQFDQALSHQLAAGRRAKG